MRIIIGVCYIFAVLTILSFVVKVVLALVMTIGGYTFGEQSATAFGARTVMGMIMIGGTLLGHGLVLLVFMASAESIRVWLDIQQNTQEAAFYTKLGKSSF